MPGKDFYKLLGVEKAATADVIKKAYRKLAKKYHPDMNPGDKAAEEKFKEITEAYAVLSDPEKRRQYDAMGPDGFRSGFDFSEFSRGGFRPRPGQRVYHFTGGGPGGGFNFDFGGLEDIFGSMFGGGTVPRGAPAGFENFVGGGEDSTYGVEVDFLTAAKGGEVELAVEGERLRVKIPPGVDTGQKIRLAGKGQGGRRGQRGDLYLEVSVRPDPVFERKGDDVHVEVPVTIVEAALGATVEVPTIDGISHVTLPEGTSSGAQLRLRSKGVYTRSGSRGDEYVRIKIAAPKKLDKKAKELLREFEKLNPQQVRKTN